LILNELVSNSLLHAFPAGGAGAVRIAFERETPALLKMTLSDNGVGFEDDVRLKDSLGYEMVAALVEQLHGSLTLQSGTLGSEITVRFPA
jgi:two-component sensor histidine kinase